MNAFSRRRRRVLLAVSAVVIAHGCARAYKPPVFQKQGFQMQWVDQITVVTPFDARIDKSSEVDFDKQLRQATLTTLKEKGYPATTSDIHDEFSSVTVDDLVEPDAEWLRHLGPPASRWILVISLSDATSSLEFLGSSGNAQLLGFMYDKRDGTLVWRDKGTSQVGQGGLIGMALVGAMDDEAIADALDELLASFPERTAQNPYLPEPTREMLPRTPTAVPSLAATPNAG